MESSLDSLAYKGSIPEAIEEAKKQKKLFVVYISGQDTESKNLESSTWSDSSVAESVSKYCILLHIQEGSTEATNFSAIYPYNSIPCITAVGYNGQQVWKNEGLVSAELLASGLEKAWLSLHIQQTFLTAALVSKKHVPSSSGAESAGQNEQGSSSNTAVPSQAIDSNIPREGKQEVFSESVRGDNGCDSAVEGKNGEIGNENSSEPVSVNERCNSSEATVSPIPADLNMSVSGNVITDAELKKDLNREKAESLSAVEPLDNLADCNISRSANLPLSVEDGMTGKEAKGALQCGMAQSLDAVEPVDDHAKTSKPTAVYLNIRLPDGVSLQEKFPLENTLRSVKDYIDRNQTSDLGPYDLAIPYPRKVFSDQDMSKSLSELCLLDRQALIVVPRQRGLSFHGGRSSSERINSTVTARSSEDSGGYFSYVGKFLSYLNPFSYLGNGASSSNTQEESQSGNRQYSPIPRQQNNLPGTERPYVPYSPNRSTPSTGRTDNSRRPSTSRFGSGSNIHTLRHDDDDSQFNDRNSFWNGNNTQYGGNPDNK